jgi:hypothetical protein
MRKAILQLSRQIVIRRINQLLISGSIANVEVLSQLGEKSAVAEHLAQVAYGCAEIGKSAGPTTRVDPPRSLKIDAFAST